MYVNALSVGMRHMLQLGKRTFLILKYLVRISPSFANTLKQVSKIWVERGDLLVVPRKSSYSFKAHYLVNLPSHYCLFNRFHSAEVSELEEYSTWADWNTMFSNITIEYPSCLCHWKFSCESFRENSLGDSGLFFLYCGDILIFSSFQLCTLCVFCFSFPFSRHVIILSHTVLYFCFFEKLWNRLHAIYEVPGHSLSLLDCLSDLSRPQTPRLTLNYWERSRPQLLEKIKFNFWNFFLNLLEIIIFQ